MNDYIRGLQETVCLRLAQERDLTLPLRHYKLLNEQTNSVTPTTKKEKPSGLRNFFLRLATFIHEVAIVDPGATGNFSKKGVGMPA